MDEEQVRALVREAIARHLGPSGRVGTSLGTEALAKAALSRPSPDAAAWKTHLSHGRFVFLAPAEPVSPCIVEPHVRCHHCGFCQSYGH